MISCRIFLTIYYIFHIQYTITYQRYDTRPAGDLRTPPTGPSPQGDRKMKEYNLKKEAAPYEVATAKMPPWFFAKLEAFRNGNELRTRNAAVNILVALGLRECGGIDSETCEEFLRSQGFCGTNTANKEGRR